MSRLILIMTLLATKSFAMDTLCTHPKYPPITYKTGEYRFYKYTAKYIPENMLHSFKILATCGDKKLKAFMTRSEQEVLKVGIFDKGFRLRKEFCLEGYSSFASYFHQKGIYYPFAMESYILLCFHQYLNKERIRWHYNKRLALNERRAINRSWKERLKWVFEPLMMEEQPAAIQDPVFMDPMEQQFFKY